MHLRAYEYIQQRNIPSRWSGRSQVGRLSGRTRRLAALGRGLHVHDPVCTEGERNGMRVHICTSLFCYSCRKRSREAAPESLAMSRGPSRAASALPYPNQAAHLRAPCRPLRLSGAPRSAHLLRGAHDGGHAAAPNTERQAPCTGRASAAQSADARADAGRVYHKYAE